MANARDGTNETQARRLPLAGLLVADFSRVLSGPLATMLLADLGATVVKIERPGEGDESRGWGPPFVGALSTYFASVNRNKFSVALDLGDPIDRHRAHELARRADVLVENFRPGTMERLGFGYETLVDVNPALVYCSICGFGREGGAEMAGYDFLVQAVGGLMSITGSADEPATKVGVAVVDVLTGLFATIGVLAGLAERERSGLGQRVDLNLMSVLLAALVNQSTGFLATGTSPRRMGNRHPSVAPYELYRGGDGELVIAVGNDRQFRKLVETLGRPELITDQRFTRNELRVAHRDELRSELEGALHEAPAGVWIERLRAVGVPCGQVNDIGQAFELASGIGLAPSFEMRAGDGAAVPQVRNPLNLSVTPVEYRLAPPGLGEHTESLETILARFPLAPGEGTAAYKVDSSATAR